MLARDPGRVGLGAPAVLAPARERLRARRPHEHAPQRLRRSSDPRRSGSRDAHAASLSPTFPATRRDGRGSLPAMSSSSSARGCVVEPYARRARDSSQSVSSTISERARGEVRLDHAQASSCCSYSWAVVVVVDPGAAALERAARGRARTRRPRGSSAPRGRTARGSPPAARALPSPNVKLSIPTKSRPSLPSIAAIRLVPAVGADLDVALAVGSSRLAARLSSARLFSAREPLHLLEHVGEAAVARLARTPGSRRRAAGSSAAKRSGVHRAASSHLPPGAALAYPAETTAVRRKGGPTDDCTCADALRPLARP